MLSATGRNAHPTVGCSKMAKMLNVLGEVHWRGEVSRPTLESQATALKMSKVAKMLGYVGWREPVLAIINEWR